MINSKREMLALWKRDFESKKNHGWVLAPDVYDYFHGKVKKLVGPTVLFRSRKENILYPLWLCNELDSDHAECAELARRMLLVISKCRKSGLFTEHYRQELEMQVCFRVGYSIPFVLSAFLDHYRSLEIEPDDLFCMARVAIRCIRAEAISFVYKKLLAPYVPKGDDYEYYLALYISVILLEDNFISYRYWLPAMLASISEEETDLNTLFLYHASLLDPSFREMFVRMIRHNVEITYFINRLSGGAEQTLRFLKKIEAPLDSYYCLIAEHRFYGVNISAEFKNLYWENHSLFMDIYAQLRDKNEESLFLLALMLKQGEGKEELARVEEKILNVARALLDCYDVWGDSDIPSECLLHPNATADEWRKKLNSDCFIGVGNTNYLIGALSVLYDFVPRVKEIIHHLFLRPMEGYSDNTYFLLEHFFYSRKDWLDIPLSESKNLLLNGENEITITQLFAASALFSIEDLVTVEDIVQNEIEAWRTLWVESLEEYNAVNWLDLIINSCEWHNYSEVVNLLSHPLKVIRKKAKMLLLEKEEQVLPLLLSALPRLCGEGLALAQQLFCYWNNLHKYGKDYQPEVSTLVGFCTDNYDRSADDFFSGLLKEVAQEVYVADLTQKMPPIVFRAIVSAYLTQEEPARIVVFDRIVALLNYSSFRRILNMAFHIWLMQKAAKQWGGIVVLYCLYASDTQLLTLSSQIVAWAGSDNGDASLAVLAVKGLILNGSDAALLVLGDVVLRAHHLQVRNLAYSALEAAADARRMSVDKLLDSLIPDLGFSDKWVRCFDYGDHLFQVTLQADASLKIYDCKWKRSLRFMPSAFGTDDVVRSKVVRKQFYDLKKQIQLIVQMQSVRMKQALGNNRMWTEKEWRCLFLRNRLMHRFTFTLIWGVYKGGKLIDTFSCLESGALLNERNEPYEFPSGRFSIGLASPSDMSKRTLAIWSNRWQSNKVVQPIPQLFSRQVSLTKRDLSGKRVVRYATTVVQSGKMMDWADRYGLIRGFSEESDCFTSYHWIDHSLQIGVRLSFEYMYIGMPAETEIGLKDLVFYRLRKDGELFEPTEEEILDPRMLPKQFVHSMLWIFDILKRKK